MTSRCLLAMGALAAVIAAASVSIEAADPSSLAQARSLYTKQCSSCHFVPDPKFKTDKLWFDRLPKTA